MKRFLHKIRFSLFLLTAVLSLQCQENGTFNPVAPPVRSMLIDQLTATPNRVSAGGGESTITGRLIDQDEVPYQDIIVNFSARQGSIDEADTTAANGSFSVRYVSGDTPGVDTITVSVENEIATLLVTLTGSSADLTLQLSNISILANGTDTALVTAVIVGRSGPLNRIPVRFETTSGSFTGQRITFSQTNIDGRASAVLTSSSSTTTIGATITASIDDISTSAPSNEEDVVNPRFRSSYKSSPTRQLDFSDAEASIPVTFRGVGISVQATPEMIPGDGQATSEIRAFVKEENNQAVPNARVTFSARLGSIPVQGITDGAGVVRVSLTSASLPGATDRIVAHYGPTLADSVDVAYASAVGRIVLGADAPSFLANGLSTVAITAQVFGGTGSPAPNVEVSFSADTGFVFPTNVITDAEGKAVTTLTSPGSTSDLNIVVRGEVVENAIASTASIPNASSKALESLPKDQSSQTPQRSLRRSDPIPSSVEDGETILPQNVREAVDNWIALAAQVTVQARGVQLRLSVNPDSLVAKAGSTSQLSVRVFETTSGNPVTGDTVRFATTLGSVPGSAILDGDGIARAIFNAGDEVGEAILTARYGLSHRAEATLELLPLIGFLTLQSDRQSIRAGGIDSLLVTAQLLDPLSAPASGIVITFRANHHPGGVITRSTDGDGRAFFSTESPPFETDSVFYISAEVGEISEEIQIAVRSISRLMFADPDSLSSGSNQPVRVTFQAFETTTHRPVVGDTVWFSAMGGVVQPFAVLNAEGVAVTTFRVGRDPGRAGAFGQLGSLAPDTTIMELVEPVNRVETAVARRSILANGIDTTLVTAVVTNILGQPSPGIWVSFSALMGTFNPAVAQTDSNGLARVIYSAESDDSDNRIEIQVRAIEEVVTTNAAEVGQPLTSARPKPFRSLRGVPALADDPFQPAAGQGTGVDQRNSGILHSESPNFAIERVTPRTADVFDTVEVETRGVNLTVRASANSIRADGRSRVGINIHLTESTTGSAIAAARLRLGASRGAIAAEGVTRNDGTFTDSLTVGIDPGTSLVWASYGDQILAGDSIQFTADPARQNLIFQIAPVEVVAGSNEQVTLQARVIDSDGVPSEGIGVAFSLEGAIWALVDPEENQEVTRYENTFRVDDREIVTSIRLNLQLRGVESAATQIYLNRALLDRVALPQGELWGDYTMILPVDRLLDGVNRFEIIGGSVNGIQDRFSVAGVRLGLVGSHLIGVSETDANGVVEEVWSTGNVAGTVNFKAALADAPERSFIRTVRVESAGAALIRLATAEDTLLANGAEESALLALVTDANGNPATSGIRVTFETGNGRIRPGEAETLGDGTASAIYTSSASEQDVRADISATSDGADGEWQLLLRGARLRLTVPEARLLADGNSEMEVRARLSTSDGAAVPGRRIDFITTRGSITPSSQTGNDGVAIATLTAADVADTALITATFGPEITDDATVIFASLIDNIDLVSELESVRADGLDSTTVTVTATDGLGRGASGVRIDLAVDRGRLSLHRVITNANGAATAKIYGTALSRDDSLRVIASTNGGAYRDTLYIGLRGVTLTVQSDHDSLAANGVATASVTARATETSSGNAVTTGRVAFSTDLGGIGATANFNENGLATATYTASPNVGFAAIRASYGSTLSAADTIRLVDRVAALDMSISPQLLLANGTSSADVVVRVSDSWGEGAPQEQVTINFQGAGTVVPNVGITNSSGEFVATARGFAASGNGALIVTASIRGGAYQQTIPIELRGVTLDITANPVLIAGDGRSTSTITAHLRETTTGHPITEDTIRFMTSAGIIPAFALTDQNGEAVVNLRSSAQPALGIVIAEYANRLADTITVAFTGRHSYIALQSERPTLLADGVDSTTITATLLDTLRRPVAGTAIYFALIGDIGTLSSDSAITDAAGEASVSWRGSASIEDATPSLRAFAGTLADTITIALRGVTMTLTASLDTLPANGLALSRITAHVVETTRGNPVIDKPVGFRTDAGLIPANSRLDQNGEAFVTLRAAANPGTATVTADFGQVLSANRRVVFTPTVGALSLQVGRVRILGDGLDTTLIVATLVDGVNNPASNVRVTFEAPPGGEISPLQVTTDEEGRASVTYSSFPTGIDSVVTISAVATGGAAAVTTTRVIGLTLDLTSTPDHLSANGRATAEVSASLYETVRHTPLVGRRVSFGANRGRITESTDTDANGIAVATFTAPSVAGDALIIAEIGDTLRASLSLPCQSSLPQSAEIAIDPSSVSINGVGRDASARLTVIIRDEADETVSDNIPIVLKLLPAGAGSFENDLDSIVVRTSEGAVSANVRSALTPGIIRFQVWYDGTLLATGGDLTVRSGPPDRITVRPDLSTIVVPGGGFTAFPLTAVVADQFGNPVEDGTSVRFSLNPDEIANISAEGRTLGGVVTTPLDPIDYPTGIWLTYSDDVAGEEVWIRAASGEDALDSTRVVLPGALVGGAPARLEAGFDSLSVEANAQSTSLLTITLIDDEGRPVADMTEVVLTSTLGIIQTPRFTAGGTATATYRAGRVAGQDTITIETGEISDIIVMTLRPGVPARLVITSDVDHLRADSTDNTTIRVSVFDRFDNPVAPGTQVGFFTTLGSIEPLDETDEDGSVTALMTAGTRAGIATIRVVAGEVEEVLNLRMESGDPTNIVFVGSDRSAIGIRGSGQVETATLRFELRDDRGVAVDSLHAAYIRFLLDGPDKVVNPDSSSLDSIATLQPDSALTDALGRVTVTLRAGYFAGAVEVSGRVGDDIGGRAIAVAIRGGAPDASHFAIQTNRCVTTGIDGTPPDTTIVTVTLGDRFSNPVTPGTVVRFSSTGGVIEGSATTDTLGIARAVMMTTRPWPMEGVDTITAQTVDYQNGEIEVETVLLVTGPTDASFDADDGWEIPFGGYRDFTLTVADQYGHSLSAGTEIGITATAFDVRGGALEGVILTGPGTIDPVTLAECDFQTEFSVRLFNYISSLETSDLALTATITSPNGDRQVITSGTGAAQVLSTELSRAILSPPEIVADGNEATLLRITLYDTLGIAIQNVPPDNIDVTGIGGDVIVTPPAVITDQFGRTSAVIVGREVGESRIETRVNGALLDDQPILTLVAGTPSVLNVQVVDRRLVVGGDTTTIVVDVSDANGNPTADGTVVTFEVDDGSLAPSTTNTIDGRATTVLTSGITAGTVQVTVRASRRGITLIGTIDNIEYIAGPPAEVMVSAPTYSVVVGTPSEITITAVDEFGNPVDAGVIFDLEVQPAGNGQISPASVSTDTTGVATATFTSGTVAGTQARVVATSGDITGQTSQFTFNPGSPGQLTLEADPESQEVGSDIDLTVTIVDAYGNPVSDTTRVVFTQDPAGGVLSPSAIRTTGGVARSVLTGVTETGNVEVSAVSSDVSASVLVTFTVGPLNAITLEAQPAVVLIGNSSTITATATDQYGNAVSDLNLNFEITTNPGGNCRLQNAERRTSGDGTASTIFTAGQTTGSAIIIVFFDVNGNNQLDEDDEINSSTFVDIGQQQ